MKPLNQPRPVNMSTCRGTEAEKEKLKELAVKYRFASVSHIWRNLLDEFFLADKEGKMALPLELKRRK